MHDAGDMIEWKSGKDLGMVVWSDLLNLEALGNQVGMRNHDSLGKTCGSTAEAQNCTYVGVGFALRDLERLTVKYLIS